MSLYLSLQMLTTLTRDLNVDGQCVSFRPVEAQDEQLLLDLYASTRAQELALTGWDQAQQELFVGMQYRAQQAHYTSHYPKAQHVVILVKDQAIGRVYVADKGDEIRILDMTILPDHRNLGIGTGILRGAMKESDQLQRCLTINVERDNPSLALFDRLGFQPAEDDGYRYLMRYSKDRLRPPG